MAEPDDDGLQPLRDEILRGGGPLPWTHSRGGPVTLQGWKPTAPARHAGGMAGRKLTPKQSRFVQEYLLDLNAAAAARRAGYGGRNADQIGSQLLGKTSVAAAVSSAQAARAGRVQIDQDYVLTRLRREAELEGEGASHSARVSALTLLGKHLGLFADRLRLEGGARLELVEEIVDADPAPPDRAAAPGPAGVPPV